MASARFADILRLLTANDVEFVVVGMTAGILQGAPTTTVDLDIVHRRTPQNVARLLRVLAELDAFYRHDPRKLRPRESHLMSGGHQLLTTSHGDLDCLGALSDDTGFEELIGNTVGMSLSDGGTLQVLDLPTLIEMKERAGRPKDLAALPILRATLDEVKRQS